jgi:hypothetical protein
MDDWFLQALQDVETFVSIRPLLFIRRYQSRRAFSMLSRGPVTRVTPFHSISNKSGGADY